MAGADFDVARDRAKADLVQAQRNVHAAGPAEPAHLARMVKWRDEARKSYHAFLKQDHDREMHQLDADKASLDVEVADVEARRKLLDEKRKELEVRYAETLEQHKAEDAAIKAAHEPEHGEPEPKLPSGKPTF